MQRRPIPSLDGLRALSVLLVVFSHSESAWRGHSTLFFYPIRDGQLGVATFFVISGFLITHLLLREQERTGELNLSRFYIRRAFRILPPCYVFIAIVALRSFMHIEQVSRYDLLAAVCYVWNYTTHTNAAVLAHLWSLSLEEQFYLLWPACVFFCRKKTCLRIALIVVAVSPVSRVVTYYLFPVLRGNLSEMLHTRVDTIMLGCIIALAKDMELWPTLFQKLNHTLVVLMAGTYLLFVNALMVMRFHGAWSAVVGITLQGLCCAVVLSYAIFHSQSWFGWLLNLPLLRHIGLISYSLYLWQQLFTFNEPLSTFPWNLFPIFVCAELSYLLVEKPSYYLRDRFLKAIGMLDSGWHIGTCDKKAVKCVTVASTSGSTAGNEIRHSDGSPNDSPFTAASSES